MDTPRLLTANRGDAGRRLDLMLRRHLTDVESATRTRVQRWIEGGRVTVNGRPASRVAARTALGDVVSVLLPQAASRRAMAAEDVRIAILHEDDHLLAIDKPAGVVVHPSYKHTQGTLLNAVLWHAQSWPAATRPSLVGRLDKLTSGVVIIAKTAAAHSALQAAAASAFEKDYLAVVYGRVNVSRGEIDLRLASDPGDRRRIVASTTVGAPSLTCFERIARVAAPRVGLSLLRCRLATGRTHQIRVHLAARGWPIVGDPAYGEPRWAEVDDPVLAAVLRTFPRQALHAWRVVLTHPVTRQQLVLQAPLPLDLRELLMASGVVYPSIRSENLQEDLCER